MRSWAFGVAAAIALVLAPPLALAGTTVITHGFAPFATDPPPWTLAMARVILTAAGDASDCAAIPAETPVGTVLRYDAVSGHWDRECGSSTPNGEIVLVFNWSDESDGLNPGGTSGYAEAAADALYAALRDPWLPVGFEGVDLLATAVHFIGHSRGSVVNSDCVERLGAVGIAVDHVTTLDPHPVDGTLDFPLDAADWGDRSPVTWSNVDFADNYWRADGGGFPSASDFDGMSIASDIDLDLGGAIEGFADVDPIFEHFEVRAWYYGTIDHDADDDGDGTAIDNELFTDWYASGSVPARSATGFFYSDVVGGARPAPVVGSDPEWSRLSIYNGDFEVVMTAGPELGIGYAGWVYHGGDKGGALVPWSSADPPSGSTYYLTLSSGADDRSLTHNRLYLDESAVAVEFDRRIALPSPNDRFTVTLTRDGSAVLVADAPMSAATDWETISFPIAIAPANAGGSYTLRLELEGGGDGVESVVEIDNLHFVPEPDGTLLLVSGIIGLMLIGRKRGCG